MVITVLAALAVRLPGLDVRPLHGDEANQAVKTGALIDEGVYEYDPVDHHGPTLYYLGLASAKLTGKKRFADTTVFTYRIVPVVFSLLLLALLWPLRDALGGRAMLWGAWGVVLSPACVFYSRYYIQETLLVCFTLGALACAYRYARRPGLSWALSLGFFLALMHTTKETAVFAYASMVGGLIVTCATTKKWDVCKATLISPIFLRHAFAALVLGVVVSVTLYSSFFTYARGPLDSILTYGNYFQRAGGAGIHDKPWYYYLSTLAFVQHGPGPWWSEAVILVAALFGAWRILRPGTALEGDRNFLRFLLAYTVLMTAFYSAIPYKTPWTLLSFYQGILLLSGVGFAGLIRIARPLAVRVVVTAILLGALLHLGVQSYRANFRFPADPRNPYVYAHTSTAFLRLSTRLEDLADVHPDGRDLFIRVIQPDQDYWPLPWYLRTFGRVGYWHELPDKLDADVIIADMSLGEEIEERVEGSYMGEMHGLRPGVLRVVYIEQGLWDAFMETRR